MNNMYKGEYVPPTLTVDSVIFQIINAQLCVLLIARAQEPFRGSLALPGGYNAVGETTHEAMKRTLLAKAGISTDSLGLIEQLYTFDTVARDPRGHAVSVTYMGLGKDLTIKQSKGAQNPVFIPVSQLPELAYDHDEIIKYSHERLRAKITYTNAAFALLPKLFTLSQLQGVYEAILGKELDKRNFRKKFLSLELIEKTQKIYKEGAHRPARLYKFKQQRLQELSRSFE
jgi:8-oxo-dGTP diphosphatase